MLTNNIFNNTKGKLSQKLLVADGLGDVKASPFLERSSL